MSTITAPIEILDCPCVPVTGEQAAIALLDAAIRQATGGYAVAINAEKILFFRSRADVRKVIENAALPYPDGIGAVLGLKWLHGVRSRKINMPIACLDGAHQMGWRLFIMGAAEDVSALAVAEIERRYPGIAIVGRMNGYEPKEAYFEAIAAARPDLVMVALGSPRQELFAAELVARVPGIFVVGCGGALDILAGRLKRAPEFLIHSGFEWLYRLMLQPHRWRRQRFLPLFLIKLVGATLRQRLGLAPATPGRQGD